MNSNPDIAIFTAPASSVAKAQISLRSHALAEDRAKLKMGVRSSDAE